MARKTKTKPARRSAGVRAGKQTRASSKRAAPKARTGSGAAAARPVGKGPVLLAPAETAELIVRQGFLIDATGGHISAVPEVVVMANAEGLEYLARVFGALAAAARKGGDAGEGVHLPRLTHPVNSRLSDDLDFRFVPLTEENRRAMFKQHGVDMKSKQRGSLFDRYQETLSQFGRLQAQMRREDWMAAQAAQRGEG